MKPHNLFTSRSFALLGMAATALLPLAANAAESLTIYSGRTESLVAPIINQFKKSTGIDVTVRYGGTAQLAIAIAEEGAKSPADVIWAQDAGALGALNKAGALATLPESITTRVPELFRNHNNTWVATSGRARVLAYSPERVAADALPKSIFDLTDPKYKGRVGWAPSNASFQTFVTAMTIDHGVEKTRAWLEAMKVNETKAYAKNAPIVQGIAAGEVDFGLPNHYYLLRFKASDEAYPVAQTFFQDGDTANMINVAGVGMLKSSKNVSTAEKFILFLLSPVAQQFFTSQVFEYPVTDEVIASNLLEPFESVLKHAPKVDLEKLDNLEATLKLLSEVGLL